MGFETELLCQKILHIDMNVMFPVILLILTVSLHRGDACGTNNIQCLSDTSFQYCIIVGTQILLIEGVINCGPGTVCSETRTFVCIDLPATTVPSTTTVTTISTTVATVPGNCTEAGRYPADACDQYWECVAVMWWLDLVLQTCAAGLSYNVTSQECVANATCASTTTATESTTVTTTVIPAAGPPTTCTETGRYIAETCNQYYECVFVMWWYDLVLQTCNANQQYDANTQQCVANSTCIV